MLVVFSVPAIAAAQDAKGAATIIDFFRASGIWYALLWITGAYLTLRAISRLTVRFSARFTDRRLLAQQVNTVLRFSIYILTAVMVVRSLFQLERETMLALTGTLAVAVGFALKDLMASLFAGIMILFDRPFQVGDRVTFGDNYGEISAIGLRSVRMVTLDDSMVTIPNNKFLTDVVVSGNAGALDMQIVIDLFIAPDSDLTRAKRIVYEAVRTSRFVYLEKPVVVLVNDLIHENYIATRLRAKAYVLDVHYEKAFETDVTERVKAGFATAGIRPPSMRHHAEAMLMQPPEKPEKGHKPRRGEQPAAG
jgi:small-conductance mechanosensitive channel